MAAALAASDPWAGPPPDTAETTGLADAPWADEGVVHVGGPAARPLTGGGIARDLGRGVWLGGRFLLPVAGDGPCAADLYARRYFTPDRPASLYLEADATAWKQGAAVFPSGSALLGVRVRVHPRLAVGGSLGPTILPAEASAEGPGTRLGPVRIAPRMFAAVDFLLAGER